MIGVKFGDYHSYDDFGLLLVNEEIEVPEARTTSAEIEGRDGDLDLTPALGDTVRFKDRTLAFEFTMRNAPSRWVDVSERLQNTLQGQKVNIIRDLDPDWYYVGRCHIDTISEISEALMTLTIECSCEPLKNAVEQTIIEVPEGSSAAAVYLPNQGLREVIPQVTVTDETSILYGSSSLSLSAGTYDVTAFPIPAGGAEWTVTCSGTMTVTYREMKL